MIITIHDSKTTASIDTLGAQLSAVHRAGLQHEGGVVLSKITQGLGSLNGLAGDESDGRGTLEVLSQEVETDLLGGQARQRVLCHGVGRVLAQAATQLLQLADGQAAVLGQQDSVGCAEALHELGNCCHLVGLRHGPPSRYVTAGKKKPDTQDRVGRTLDCSTRLLTHLRWIFLH